MRQEDGDVYGQVQSLVYGLHWRCSTALPGFGFGCLVSAESESTLAMVKLTPELLAQAPSTINPVRERQLDLRGGSIKELFIVDLAHVPKDTESLPSKTWESPRHVSSDHRYRSHQTRLPTQDQHDAIDLTDNSITALGNLPLLKRLRTLLLANNRVSSISSSINLSVPNLTTLVLTANSITELGDLEPFKELKNLKYLSLIGNPVREKKWYREWLAWKIPSLRVLDFQRVRDKVRQKSVSHLSSIQLECFCTM